MDPNIAYITLLDESADPDTRVEAALALRDWIRSGGFLPIGSERREVVLNIDSVIALKAVPA